MGANSGLDGGAIFAFGVALVTNSTLTNTTASNIGGGMSANDGNGVATAGTVANSTIANDVATNSGGGISSNGAVVVTNSTIANNTGAGLANGAIDAGSGTGVTITNSTIAFDTAHDLGGVVFTNGSVVVTNSTLSSNTTSQDGGAIFAASGVQLVYATTVMDNSAPRGANLADGGSPLTSFGSVVAHPHGGGTDCANLTGASKGWNWDDDGSCGFGGGPGDHSNAGDPQLGALANNGGATETRLPLTAAASSTRSQSPRAKPTGRPASRPTNVAVHDPRVAAATSVRPKCRYHHRLRPSWSRRGSRGSARDCTAC